MPAEEENIQRVYAGPLPDDSELIVEVDLNNYDPTEIVIDRLEGKENLKTGMAEVAVIHFPKNKKKRRIQQGFVPLSVEEVEILEKLKALKEAEALTKEESEI